MMPARRHSWIRRGLGVLLLAVTAGRINPAACSMKPSEHPPAHQHQHHHGDTSRAPASHGSAPQCAQMFDCSTAVLTVTTLRADAERDDAAPRDLTPDSPTSADVALEPPPPRA